MRIFLFLLFVYSFLQAQEIEIKHLHKMDSLYFESYYRNRESRVFPELVNKKCIANQDSTIFFKYIDDKPSFYGIIFSKYSYSRIGFKVDESDDIFHWHNYDGSLIKTALKGTKECSVFYVLSTKFTFGVYGNLAELRLRRSRVFESGGFEGSIRFFKDNYGNHVPFIDVTVDEADYSVNPSNWTFEILENNDIIIFHQDMDVKKLHYYHFECETAYESEEHKKLFVAECKTNKKFIWKE